VVQVKERITPRVLADDDPLVSYSGPMIVLFSRLSASASEIVAGALQDYGRALIVGDSKTHGKGTVQSILELGQEKMGALKLTTSVYYRISGASTQLRGVEADIVIRSPFDTMEYGEDYLKNAMPWDSEDPAIYRSVPNLRRHLPRLKELAVERQNKNPDFATYLELLSRIEAINSIETLPLEINARRKLAKTEKELLELRDKLVFRAAPAPGEEKKEKENPDLVLGEALHILADLVALEGKGTDLVPPAPPITRMSLPDSISDWFRRKKN
ncbi:MAG: carboxy terminal-processing peptidase, partial [Planctomycetota bacterium]|jgi:carboxyl-terminal processing protease